MMESKRRARWVTGGSFLDQRAAVLVVGLGGLLISAALFARGLHAAGGVYDEGFVLEFADRVRQGAVTYRDFYSNYGPGLPWLLAGAFRILGTHLGVERAVAGAVRLGLCATLYWAGARYGVRYAIAAMALSTFWGMALGPTLTAWIVGVALATASVTLATGIGSDGRVGKWRYIGAGALAGSATLFRPELSIAASAAILPVAYRYGRRFSLPWLLGFAIALVPGVIHVLIAGAPTVFENLVIDPLRAAPSRHLSLLPIAHRGQLTLLLLTCAACAALAVIGRAVRRRLQEPRDVAIASLALLCLSLTPQALQRADQVHFLYVGILSVSVVPLYIAYWNGSAAHPRIRGKSAVLLALLFAGSLVATVSAGSLGFSQGSALAWDGRDFLLSPNTARDTRQILDDLYRYGERGQRLFVGPDDFYRSELDDAELYYLARRFTPATYYIQFDPGVSNRPGSGLDQDIASADYAVLVHYPPNGTGPFIQLNPGGAAPSQVIINRFCMLTRHGDYTLFRRCR